MNGTAALPNGVFAADAEHVKSAEMADTKADVDITDRSGKPDLQHPSRQYCTIAFTYVALCNREHVHV